MNIIIILFILITIGICIIFYYNINTYIIKMRKDENWDLKPSYNLTKGLSIITLCQGGKDYNCLIDTGSNVSHITSFCSVKITPIEETDSVTGITGESINCKIGIVNLYYNKYKYEIPVRIGSIDEAAKMMKDSFGVHVDMLLGSDFLTKYNKVLDYKNMIVHTVK